MRKRREEGLKPRGEYIKEQHNKTDDKLFKLQQLLEENPKVKQKEIAAMLGISERHLRRLKSQL